MRPPLMKCSFAALLCFLTLFSECLAQFPPAYSSSQLYHELQKASTTGSVLYIAAHPDDENTRLISYLVNKSLNRTAYLSLTRGDGGQNLIGTEIGSAIGVLRTQELLTARAIDGGEQFFSRAVDFGYSKSSEETFDKWNREEVLHDMVWVIRSMRPDVLITRFPPDNYAGHGHHKASAMLAEDAFEAAGNPKRFPEQLDYVEVWQPKRLYFNASTWWNKDLPQRARNNDKFIRVNVGEHNPLLGESYARIAARSRSQHQSQGFGTDVYYGMNIEYLEYVMGEKAGQEGGIMDGVDQSWSRLGLKEADQLWEQALEHFDHQAPENCVPHMLDLLQMLEKAPESPLKTLKTKEVERLVLLLAGLDMEAIATHYYLCPGDPLDLDISFRHHYRNAISIEAISVLDKSYKEPLRIEAGEYERIAMRVSIPAEMEYSNPYWLQEPYENLYKVADFDLLGKAENDPAISVQVRISIDGEQIEVEVPVQYKSVDPVKAVQYRPLHIVPALCFNFPEEVIVARSGSDKDMVIYAECFREGASGLVKPILPKGWKAEPSSLALDSLTKGSSTRLEFKLIPGSNAEGGKVSLRFEEDSASEQMAWSLSEISYDHIPDQILMKVAEVELRPISLEMGRAKRIAYLEGPGDDVAKYLRAVGYQVDVVDRDDIMKGKLAAYHAVITGIRAFNTREDMHFLHEHLMNFVKEGGTMMVQYNTAHRLKTDRIGPYIFSIGRDRVSIEDSEARLLLPEHPVFSYPNKIAPSDFDDWVQERGLYFASEWDDDFEALIGWNDPDEPERRGGLIAAPYGKGYFVYTGISFFRQLPAGVGGAYRLLSNILNLAPQENTQP